MAYDTGCKGVTVYRDGCRKGQPMALKETSEKKSEPKPAVPAAPAAHVPLKPVKTATILSAVRIRSNTPFGHMHLTISVDPKTERELEVFAQLGKAGDVAASDLEAICRMVSLFLRSGGTLDLVMDQLEGIGSHLSIPTKDGRVMSLGDALGKTIHKYWQAKKNFGLKAILLGEVDIDALHGHTNGNGNGNGHANGTPSPLGGEGGKGPSASAIIGEAVAHVLAKGKAPTKTTYSDELLSSYKLKCPECGSGTLAFMEGCVKCASCGYSKC